MGTIAQLGEFLQNKIAPAIRSQLPEEVPLLKSFETRDDVEWNGAREYIKRIEVGRNEGVYFTAEGGRPPEAGEQQVEAFRIGCRYTHGQINWTVQSKKATQGVASGFADIVEYKTKGLLKSLKWQRLFGLWGDGRGVRALINGDPGTGTTLTLDSPGGVAGSNHGNRYLNVGMYVVAINPATGALRAGGTRRINAVAAGGNTVTVDAAIDAAWADNDYIVKAYGSNASINIRDTDWQHPPMGMLGMLDNGAYVNTYFGLSRTTFPILNATRINNVGGLSADVIQRAIDVATQIGGGDIREHWMSMDVRRAYLTIMQQDRRYTAEHLMRPDALTKSAKGGYDDGMTVGGRPVKTDPHSPYGMWFGLDPDGCKRYVMEDGEWADETGAIWRAVANEVDTLEATYRIYDQFIHEQPNTCFRLEDISTTFAIAHVF